jgi:hypothetical protein
MKDWEIIADNLSKTVGIRAACQPWILTGEQPGLLTHIEAESASLRESDKS